jgi:hypothetical protein
MAARMRIRKVIPTNIRLGWEAGAGSFESLPVLLTEF